MSRKPRLEEPTEMVSLRVPVSDMEVLRFLAHFAGVSHSDIIRDGIALRLEELGAMSSTPEQPVDSISRSQPNLPTNHQQ